MIRSEAAAMALDALPAGAMVATAFVDDTDGTATVILFERRDDSSRPWSDLTRGGAWWRSVDIATTFDDMVVTANPDMEST